MHAFAYKENLTANFRASVDAQRQPRLRTLPSVCITLTWAHRIAVSSPQHFQPYKQAIGAPVGSLIIHADV